MTASIDDLTIGDSFPEPVEELARVTRSGRLRRPLSHTLTGETRRHAGFRSRILDNERELIVYLPPGYEVDAGSSYPALYMQDGQNLFDRATAYGGVEWGLDETAQKLIIEDRIAPLIIVGINNMGEQRIEEYTPTRDSRLNKGGKADLYGRFLIEEVKPFIDERYRTLSDPDHTGLGGSSLGGLVSLYLGLKHPDVFGRLMVMSPSAWWDQAMMLKFIPELRAKSSTRIWLDIGTLEGKYTPRYVRTLRDQLVRAGWRLTDDLHFLEVENGEHNERAWGARAGQALEFLFRVRRPRAPL
ncbi:MAG: alpha/beta hydrolase [Acidobacteriota bacterium]|nr:MAG: alpha/beta hydrolase [Acidobacteriota bacterium]